MIKGLKELKELKKRYGKNFSMQDDERTHIIEQELKRLEEYEKADDKVCAGSLLTCTHDFQTLWKRNKALEIIINKKVDIFLIYKFSSVDKYNDWLGRGTNWNGRLLTEEEFNAVREVLL